MRGDHFHYFDSYFSFVEGPALYGGILRRPFQTERANFPLE
jgi:hypothetical protein